MNFSKGLRDLLSIFLILFSITTYADWPILVTKGMADLIQRSPHLKKVAKLETLSILERLKIRADLPKKTFDNFKDARNNPSRLFYSMNFRKVKKDAYSSHPDVDVLSLSGYRSAIEVLQSDIHRAFFFSLFDPSDMNHVEGLFMGLRAHQITHTEIGFDEALEISRLIGTDTMWDEWVLFKEMAEQAISEGQRVIDIEASFFSGSGNRDFLLGQSGRVRDSFRTFTDNLISRAEESGRLADLYKNPYLNLPMESPYREKFLSALQKSDLSDKDLILKWWRDVHFLETTASDQNKFLKPHIKAAFDSAKRGGHFDEKIFIEDPFITELIKATKENNGLLEAANEVISSLRGRKYGISF